MGNKVYDIVTEKILKALESGIIPWSRPWQTSDPFNAYSGRKYTGINSLLLDMSGRGPGWITAKRIEELGGDFKGAKSELVTLYNVVQKKKKLPSDEPEQYWMLRYYKVFPISEVRGLPEKYYKKNAVIVQEHQPVEEAEAIIAKYLEETGVKMSFGGNRAYYQPSTDSIQIPVRESFVSIEEYYCTVFHEIMHSTQSRCKIQDTYAGNELRAEIGAAMLLAHIGLDHSAVIQNATAYCSSWASRIRDEKNTLVVSAASKAYSGVDMILGKTTVKEEEYADSVC